MNKRLPLAILAVLAIVLVYTSMGEDRQGAGLQSYTALSINDVEYTNEGRTWLITISQRASGDLIRGILSPDDGDRRQDGNELVDPSEGTATKSAEIILDPRLEGCMYTISSNPNLQRIWQYNSHYYTEYNFIGEATDNNNDIIRLFFGGPAYQVSNFPNIEAVSEDCLNRGGSTNPRDYYIGVTRNCNNEGVGCSGTYTPFCIYPSAVGNIGRTQTDVIFSTELGIKIDGVTKSGTLTNSAFCPGDVDECGSSINIGNYGKAFWYGSLVTGAYCPIVSDMQMIPAYISRPENVFLLRPPKGSSDLQQEEPLEAFPFPKLWNFYDRRIEDLVEIINHKREIEPRLGENFLYSGGHGINVMSKTLKSTNNNLFAFVGADSYYSGYYDTKIRPTKPRIYNGQQVEERDSLLTVGSGRQSETNGQMLLSVDPGTYIYPQFKVEIYDTYLPIEKWTVETQGCDPQLEVLTSDPIVGGTLITPIRFRATNGQSGSNQCDMEAYVTCDTGYSSPLAKPLGTFAIGQSKEFNLDFSCQVEEEISDNCQVTLRGVRGERATRSLQTLCKPNYECTPGTTFCEGNYRVKCEDDGTYGNAVYCDRCLSQGDQAVCINITRETDCDDGIDNDGDSLVDQEDPDCQGGPPGWDDWVFSALVATLVALIVFGAVFSYRKRPKNKVLISLISATIVFIVVYLIMESLELDVGNPLDVFVPNIVDCGVDVIFCPIFNALESVKWLGSLLIAGFVSFFALKFFSGLRDFGKHKILVAIFTIIIFVIFFLITSALFWYAVAIGIIVGIIMMFVRGIIPFRRSQRVEVDVQ